MAAFTVPAKSIRGPLNKALCLLKSVDDLRLEVGRVVHGARGSWNRQTGGLPHKSFLEQCGNGGGNGNVRK